MTKEELVDSLGIGRIITSDDDPFMYDYIRLAYEEADLSLDPSTKNGALLVSPCGRVLGSAPNRFPPNILNTEERWNDRETKYRLVIHAEVGAIFNTIDNQFYQKDSTLICPFYACIECAKTIILAKIKRVVGHLPMMMKGYEHPNWKESMTHGIAIMTEAGIECQLYDGLIEREALLNHERFEV